MRRDGEGGRWRGVVDLLMILAPHRHRRRLLSLHVLLAVLGRLQALHDIAEETTTRND
jgi:hypothetical protein